MQYRFATIDDLDAISNLHAESWRATYRGLFADNYLDNDVWQDRKSVWSERLTQPKQNQYVLLALDDEQLNGFICVYTDEHPQWGNFIDNLHVASVAQGKGVGKTLMMKMAQWVDQHSQHKGMYLEVLEENQQARNFYHRLGAKHQQSKLWLPPGSAEKIGDLTYVWDTCHTILALASN